LFAAIPPLDSVLSAVAAIVVGLNRKLQIVFHNRDFLELVGPGGADVLGMRIGQALHCVHQRAEPESCGTTEHCPGCGALQSIFVSLGGIRDIRECQITRWVQGTALALDLRVTSSPIRYGGEEFTLVSLIDIGHEKRRRALEKIFFHDVLNTASQIRRCVKMAGVPAAGIPNNLDMLDALTDQLVSEVRGQRDLMAAEDNELSVNPSPIDSLRLLEEIRRQLTHPALSEGHTIRIHPDSCRITFVSDPSLVKRVLTNMVKNALEATSPREEIVLSCRAARGRRIEFRVYNPAYIPRDIQQQVFQRFFSTKGKDRGLGTYGMRLLSEQYLKGKVSFFSSPEMGTCFLARYPVNLLCEG
jgi:signal transduction histidine kinase